MIMLIRIIKSGLSLAMGLIVSIITFNNLTDYQPKYEFVKHVMSMDTIFPESKLRWRATSPKAHHFVYQRSSCAKISFLRRG